MMSAVIRNRFVLLGLVALLALALAASAQARTAPAKVEIGKASLGSAADGDAVVLVPVSYPIQLSGRWVPFHIALVGRGGDGIERLKTRVRLSAGGLRSPDPRRRFTFVHRFDLRGQPEAGWQNVRVRVRASALLDVDRDGIAEARSRDRSLQRLTVAADRSLCSTVPAARTKPGRRTQVLLPACASSMRWRVVRRPEHGSAQIRNGALVYRSHPRFRGTDSLVLSGGQSVRLTVGSTAGIVVRALGDSVTAGFGYYASGKEMGFSKFYGCRPAEKEFNDACSSNSLSEKSKPGPVEYAPDYGLARNISWAAQWANQYGITNYENLAISGSEPVNWAPGGVFYEKTKQIESEDPDYLLLTLGANPMLSNMLTEPEQMWCAFEASLAEFEACIKGEFAKVELRKNLKSVYTDLVKQTTATIYVMQYHLSVPWSAVADSSTEIALASKLLNQEIAAVVAEVGSSRLQVVTPPHFNVGIDVSPVYPADYTCRFYPVDGPSVQSTGTQDELEGHLLSFCSGPAGGGPPWVINGDTGIHPSAAGYAQMASQVPAPS
jgi:hypothetical protein